MVGNLSLVGMSSAQTQKDQDFQVLDRFRQRDASPGRSGEGRVSSPVKLSRNLRFEGKLARRAIQRRARRARQVRRWIAYQLDPCGHVLRAKTKGPWFPIAPALPPPVREPGLLGRGPSILPG